MIYHVVSDKNWKKAELQGYYEAPSLAMEGFIHCSIAAQVNGVLERYYQNEKGLLLLHIAEDKLSSPLVYELAPQVNEEFPHLYGRLNLDAVVNIEKL